MSSRLMNPIKHMKPAGDTAYVRPSKRADQKADRDWEKAQGVGRADLLNWYLLHGLSVHRRRIAGKQLDLPCKRYALLCENCAVLVASLTLYSHCRLNQVLGERYQKVEELWDGTGLSPVFS
eukprot:1739354-Rhodomonas_salina.3